MPALVDSTGTGDAILEQLQRAVVRVCAEPAPDASAAAVSTLTQQKSVAQEHRYLILKELGRGTMGTVYLVQDTALRRQMAMKIPHFQPGASG